MGADSAPRHPGSFHALGVRLLRESFPAQDAGAYMEKAVARVRQAAGTRPLLTVTDGAAESRVVLIVDDEEDLRDIMRRMLERGGFETLGAGDVEEALSVCRSHPGRIDLALVDIGVPGAADRAFASTAADLRPGLRTVYVSGLPREIAVSARLIGPDDLFVKKPFTAATLLAVVGVAEARRGSTTR